MSALAYRLRQARTELALVRAGRRIRDRVRLLDMLIHSHLRVGRTRHLLRWLPSRGDEARELRLNEWTVNVRRGDGIPVYEQFGLDVYRAEVRGPVRAVVDLGANVGLATMRFARRYPDARLVCVEPDPAARELLSLNLGRQRIAAQIHEAAIVGTPGHYAVEEAHHPGANRIVPAPDGEIEGITLATLLDRAGLDRVDLMKVDIEGGEREMLDSVPAWADRVRALILELHHELTPADVESRLAPHGYRRRTLPERVRHDDLVYFARS